MSNRKVCPLVEQPTVKTQSIGLTSVSNARELGGYLGAGGKRVRDGVLLRTASIGGISGKDTSRLVNDLNLATIVDFRMTFEAQMEPEPAIEGVRSVALPIMDEQMLLNMSEVVTDSLSKFDDPNDAMMALLCIAVDYGIVSKNMYVDWLASNAGKAGYRSFFEELAALPEGSSILWHCSQGKDRTGIAAMLVLYALGVDDKTIMRDYLLTNEFNVERIAHERKVLEEQGFGTDKLDLYLMAMDQVCEETMQNALEWLRMEYGSAIGYLTEGLGVTNGQIHALQEKFLV